MTGIFFHFLFFAARKQMAMVNKDQIQRICT